MSGSISPESSARPDASEPGGPTAPAKRLTLRSQSVAQTRRLGARLGRLALPGDVVLLEGDLGAGKTALTQGIAEGLGVRGVVNSPTFTILKEYAGRLPLYHFDLYRIESDEEVYALGFEDYLLGDGVAVVEWAERGEPAQPGQPTPWPASYLRLRLHAEGATTRVIAAAARGSRGEALLAAWAEATAGDTVETLEADDAGHAAGAQGVNNAAGD